MKTAEHSQRSLLAVVVMAIVCFVTIIAAALSSSAAPQKAISERPAVAVACPPRGITVDGVVTRVIDGDTIVVTTSVEYHVRLIDCWAAESRSTNAQEKAKGLIAKTRMQELAAGKAVRVHLPGQENLTAMITLGRVLGRVWLLSDDNPATKDLSTIMVTEKLATPEKQKKLP